MRRAFALILAGLVLILVAIPVAAADNDKWFVCKYVGTPGVDEVLQTGDNPISVSESAIGISPVVAGAIFADSQGRSLVLEQDIGQGEPAAECPPTLPPPPTPSPSPSPSLSASPSSSPSPSLSVSPSASPTPSPPVAAQFSVEVCPLAETASLNMTDGLTALDIPEGQSAIRFSARRAALLIILLNVRVDDQLVTLENTLGDGTVGDLIVSPGVHTWSISNQADTEVLASGVVNCPVCNPATVTPPPVAPVPDTGMPIPQAVTMVAGIMLSSLGVLLLTNALAVRRRKED
jgi:hypothetical protein